MDKLSNNTLVRVVEGTFNKTVRNLKERMRDLPDLSLLNMSTKNALEEIRQKVLIHAEFIKWLSNIEYSCSCWQCNAICEQVEIKMREWVSTATTVDELMTGYKTLIAVKQLLFSMDGWPSSEQSTNIVYPLYVREKIADLVCNEHA